MEWKKKLITANWDKQTELVNYNVIPPLDTKKFHKIKKNTLKGTSGPLSSILNLINQIELKNSCENFFFIFDGIRRYDLKIVDLGSENIKKNNNNVFHGKAVVCGLKFYPIGGHRLKSNWKPEKDKFTDIKLYFGLLENELYFPVKLSLKRWFGTVEINLIQQ